MKDCTGFYRYKGFLIRFDEYYQAWRLEPYYLLKDNDDDLTINFEIHYHNAFSPEFDTIKQAKEYIKNYEEELKQEIEIAFKRYKEEYK